MLNLHHLDSLQNKPPPFERGAPMWNNPYIATQMLDFHLNESHDIASRRPEIIDSTVKWITRKCNLQTGMHLLDLGCGPGLYTRRFAENGLHVTGIDYSQNSIDYAKNHDTQSTYICQNYLDLTFADDTFDLVMMVYGDFCVLSIEERDKLLLKINRSLKPNGYLIFDVTQPQHHEYLDNHNQWSLHPQGGFWTPEPYLILEKGFKYPHDIWLQQYIVIKEDGKQTTYRNWYHDYTPNTLSPILADAEFQTINYYSDLHGTPYSDIGNWCGVVSRKSL